MIKMGKLTDYGTLIMTYLAREPQRSKSVTCMLPAIAGDSASSRFSEK